MTESGKEKGPMDPTATAVFQAQPQPYRHFLPIGSGQIRVEVVGGPMDGKECLVSTEEVTIGRGRANAMTLPHDLMVSSHHARILREGDHYWLEDLGSRNGTFLGDKRIKGRVLIGPGTIFVVGRTCLEFTPR